MTNVVLITRPGRRPQWWKLWCSWAELMAGVLHDHHGRVGDVVAGIRCSVEMVRRVSRDRLHPTRRQSGLLG